MTDIAGSADAVPPLVDASADPFVLGSAPAIGALVPAFAVSNQYGEWLSSAQLADSDYFLVFYPFAFSRVCSSELEQLETVAAEFSSRGVRIYGVSVDHKFALRAYAEQMGLSFGLLADFWPHGEVSTAFGCFDAERGMSTRSTFLVSGGRIVAHFSTPAHQARDLNDYRRAVEGLRSGH